MSASTETHHASEAAVRTAPRPRPALGSKNGRLHQVPHIAGLILGVFSVLVFLWSISPVLRYYVHVPREYVDAYYFDAPDTSLSWALVVALLAAALASRKRIAWWLLTIYLVLILITNVIVSITDRNVNAMVAAVVQVVLIGILIAARPEFYTRVRAGRAGKPSACSSSVSRSAPSWAGRSSNSSPARCRRVNVSCGRSTA